MSASVCPSFALTQSPLSVLTFALALASVTRKALKDTTLIDGTFIPKDTLLAAAAYPTHFDDNIYENASVFDPFRFSQMREAQGEGTKHHLVHTSVEYMPFGHGKHAWCVPTFPCCAVLLIDRAILDTVRAASLPRTS